MFLDTSFLRNDEIYLRLRETKEGIPEKQYLPSYKFDICLLDDTKIGTCDLRIGHNSKLYIGGNIGYEVYEEYRGHKYAAKACKLLFELARKHDLGYVIITCVPTNKASSRTCELVGGKFLEIADIPEDNEMYAQGKRQVMIYKITL